MSGPAFNQGQQLGQRIHGCIRANRIGQAPVLDSINERARVRASGPAVYRTTRALRRAFPIADLVGWWHSHPGFGTHFSSTDRETQATYSAPWSVGLVVDPTESGGAGWGAMPGMVRGSWLEVGGMYG